LKKKISIPRVIIRTKSYLQKDDCLFCEDGHSSLEAHGSKGKNIVSLRCCASEACIEKAKKMALKFLRKN
jgi:hypothetical protein